MKLIPCKWLLQSDISEADKERVIRENGVNFAIEVARAKAAPATEEK